MDEMKIEGNFSLGKVVITASAKAVLNEIEVTTCLIRHSSGDWGDISDEDKKINDNALKQGDRLLSSYKDHNGTKFWIITEWDRSVTTVLLPEDY